MIRRILKFFGSGIAHVEREIAPPAPLVSEYSTAMDEGVKLEDRLEHVITAWEKRTHNSFKDVILDGHKGDDGWVEKLQRNAALFFGSREYEAYRNKNVVQNQVKKEVMCKAVHLWCKEVTYWLDGEERKRIFESDEEANIFAIRVLAARKSVYAPEEQQL